MSRWGRWREAFPISGSGTDLHQLSQESASISLLPSAPSATRGAVNAASLAGPTSHRVSLPPLLSSRCHFAHRDHVAVLCCGLPVLAPTRRPAPSQTIHPVMPPLSSESSASFWLHGKWKPNSSQCARRPGSASSPTPSPCRLQSSMRGWQGGGAPICSRDT